MPIDAGSEVHLPIRVESGQRELRHHCCLIISINLFTMSQRSPQTRITIIYVVNCLTNVLINFDHGIIPACTKEMKADLAIDDFELGILGSAVYAGLLTGSVVGSHLFLAYATKTIVYMSVVFCGLSLSLFLITRSLYMLILSRFLVGFFQIFLVIYFPVWIDFFGGPFKTLWLTFMQLGVALGAVAGYAVTSMILTNGGTWAQPYEIQIMLLIPCALFYMWCAEYNLDTTGRMQLLQSQPMEKPQVNLPTRIRELLTNPMFIYSMLSLTTLFFVVTGIQFWVSDYFRNVLNVPQPIVFKAYMFVSLSAPILGVAVGGTILHYSGGYDGENALQINGIEAMLASLCGSPIPFIDSFYVALMLLWLMLFFGGSLVPGMTGIMLTSIPPDQRSMGNSVSHVFQELLGYLPSPMLYGLAITLTGGQTSRWGMGLLVAWSFQGMMYIWLAHRYQKKGKQVLDVKSIEPQQPKEFELQTVEEPVFERGRSQSYTRPPHGFFNELRKQTSMSMADSQILGIRSRAMSIDTPKQQITRSIQRKSSVMDTLNTMAGFYGRASIDVRTRNQIEQ